MFRGYGCMTAIILKTVDFAGNPNTTECHHEKSI